MSALRLGRFVADHASKGLLVSAVKSAAPAVAQVAGICHKDHLDPEIVARLEKPWPYERRKYTWYHQNVLKIDRCVNKFTENTKVIVVEGNIGAGKSKFAKELADQLGMKHIPEASLERIFVNKYGFDYRTLNWRLPEPVQMCDVRMFYENPHHQGIPIMQLGMYRLRFEDYIDALAHMYNTGQGVVLERSPWSDWCFVEAAQKSGYFMPKDAIKYLGKVRQETESELQRPHLVIYLDVPSDIALKRIKARGIKHEVESKVFANTDYLNQLEKAYKEKCLPEMERHAELIVYDWSKFGDMELVIEDLEKLDFDQYEKRGEKMEDWRMFQEQDFDNKRRYYTHWYTHIWSQFEQPTWDAPSISPDDELIEMHDRVFEIFGPKFNNNWDPSKESVWKIITGGNYRDRLKDGLHSPLT